MRVELCTFADLFDDPGWPEVKAEYVEETANPDLGSVEEARGLYEEMEHNGMAYATGAWDGDQLVGLMVMTMAPMPHYGGRWVGQLDAIFVCSSHRRGTGLGQALVQMAEGMTEDFGAEALIAAVPMGGVLHRTLPKRGYKPYNVMMSKRL